MKAQVFFISSNYDTTSFTVDCISAGVSLATGTVTIHCDNNDGTCDMLIGYGFQPINGILSNILTRYIKMENEPTITGLVVK